MTGERPAPRLLGRYALYDRIASGGMAAVHLGRLLGPEGFARTVAIKRLHSQFAEDPEFVSMFLDEARMVARISHPNVVPTLDVVSTDGELFLVMEYVHGESLARLARCAREGGARIPPEMIVTLMTGVLHGLHAAHEACNERGQPLGIVHRDVSPQNILVGVDGSARVLDFGVAKAVGRIQTTREGQLKGKLSYMAPEQLRGQVSRASDVYAAAIVLWEVLAGRKLFEGENEGQVFDRVLRGCRTPPSAFADGVSPTLDAVTLRGLSVDPRGRYPTAREMARALEDAVPHVPASKIGEWVEGLLPDSLAARRECIKAIESETATTAPAVPRRSRDARPPADERGDGAAPSARSTAPGEDEARAGIGTSIPVTEDLVPTQLSTASVSAPGRAPASPRLGARVALAAVVATAVAAVVLLGSWTRRSPELAPTKAQAPTPTATVAADPVATTPPASVAESAPVSPPVPSAAASGSGSAGASSAPRAASAAPRRPTATAAPLAAPSPRSRCDPPWTVDSRGVQSFKKECL